MIAGHQTSLEPGDQNSILYKHLSRERTTAYYAFLVPASESAEGTWIENIMAMDSWSPES